MQEVQEAAPQATSKGGGFFGMFQQETVQAEEQPGAFGSNGTSSSSAPDSIPTPPSPEEISRAVTKRGRGPPPNRKSIRELNPKKSAQVRSPWTTDALPPQDACTRQQSPPGSSMHRVQTHPHAYIVLRLDTLTSRAASPPS